MEALVKRVNDIVETCWSSFSAKVGNGLLSVNKEASMQLQFAYLLKNTLDLVVYAVDETVRIEMEPGIFVNGRLRECDLLIHIRKAEQEILLPVEMKCYRTWSSSGGRRGAQDIFRYNLYEDLELLECYSKENSNMVHGVQLTMTDSRNFVHPKTKDYKSWKYDISEGTVIDNGVNIDVPIGGKPTNLRLEKTYRFNWTQINNFYFLKIQGN